MPLHLDITNLSYKYLKLDIRNEKKFDQIPKFNYSYIINLAAISDITKCCNNPKLAISTNVLGHYNILNFIKRISYKKLFLYASSSAIYGSNSRLNVPETAQPKPKSLYGYSKLMNEIYSEMYCELFNFKTLGLRFFNIYGFEQVKKKSTAVIALWYRKLKNEDKIIIHTGKDINRDFLHVSDAVKIIYELAKKNIPYKFLNIGSGKPTCLSNLFNILKEYYLNKFKIIKSKIVYKKIPSHFISNSSASMNLVKKFINLNNIKTIKTGIQTYF
jgi:UDP-N-acetylglucosamine 4-epimerase